MKEMPLKIMDPSLYNLQKMKKTHINDSPQVELDFAALIRMPVLENLNLRGMRIHVPEKATQAPRNSILKYLDLSNTSISTPEIVNRLKTFNLRELIYLHLNDNQMGTINGLDNLHEHFPSLASITLGGSQMLCSKLDVIQDILDEQKIGLSRYSTNPSSAC